MRARRRKTLGVQAGHCGICDDERDLQVHESWQPRGLFGLRRDAATVQRVTTCRACGFAVRRHLFASA